MMRVIVERVDCTVVGAGIVGLAIARALALRGRDVLIVEQHGAIGSETSARSSEVIHAGIYYPSGSLKARLCVEGRQRLYDYLAERALPHRRCGKLLVASGADQRAALARLQVQALANGVSDLEPLDGAGARALEPALRCDAALLSPSTGIVDTHALMLSLLGDAENAGATLALRSRVRSGRVRDHGIELLVQTGEGTEPLHLASRSVVNAAGLHAQALARALAGLAPARVPARFLAKGSYFTLRGRSPFGRLVYPMPDAAGLGVHLTLDLAGQARFGPDVEWVETLDYRVDPARAPQFAAAIRSYWPALDDAELQPGYAGIRPKCVGPGAAAADFVIDGPSGHGVAGLVNLFGIESPGITASLAIGEHVARLLA
jgi:L-2-hydroxyglutarate oxidase LhgO